MNLAFPRILLLSFLLALFSACANIIPPTGGKPDDTPPKLLSIKPKDSLLNTKVSRIEMRFDEFVTVSDVSKELHISPSIRQNPTMTIAGKTVIVKIPDSLLDENTTYTLDFGKAIKDLHEGNPYSGKTYKFSTGGWFDSLSLKGKVMDAASGKLDSSGKVKALLYDAKLPFDVIAKEKPAYVANVAANGAFVFTGLPNRRFRIFALKENGDNYIFDNDDEYIGFADTVYNPALDTVPIVLSIFKEIPDTARIKTDIDETGMSAKSRVRMQTKVADKPNLDAKSFNYKVLTDTSNVEKRSQELNQPIEVYFSRKVEKMNQERIFLSADSSGIEIECQYEIKLDTSKTKLSINTSWKPNTIYTLRLLKSFAQDSSLTDAMPSKNIFRTKSDLDYGKMEIIVPERYVNNGYLLEVVMGEDSVYLATIIVSKVSLNLLSPGDYQIKLIKDSNKDGEWTTGDLKTKRHAELVIPYQGNLMMKAGWEHLVEFEPKKQK
ncbi:MAG: Ig-like domain-containing protein [Chitinophagaceae bacterium]|jgi:hypothetical protein